MGFHLLVSLTLYSGSHDKSKMYLLFHKIQGHQTFKGQGLEWRAPRYRIILPLDYKITRPIKNLNKDSYFYFIRLGWEETYNKTWFDQIILIILQKCSSLGSCLISNSITDLLVLWYAWKVCLRFRTYTVIDLFGIRWKDPWSTTKIIRTSLVSEITPPKLRVFI